jgi:hypothetical protein
MSKQIITAVAPDVRPDLFLLDGGPLGTTTPQCEAECRNRQALHALKVDWGRGVFDYGKIQAILTGRGTEKCLGEHPIAEARPDTVA